MLGVVDQDNVESAVNAHGGGGYRGEFYVMDRPCAKVGGAVGEAFSHFRRVISVVDGEGMFGDGIGDGDFAVAVDGGAKHPVALDHCVPAAA